MIHLLKHTPGDGPGALGRFLTRRGTPFRTIELANGEPLPRISNDISAVVSLGGHMDVSEEANYPFLKDETVFIKRIVQNEIPFFGICLGAQLLAKAFGADVYRGRVNERGWTKVSLTDDGVKDPLFLGVPRELTVFESHHDTFDIPRGGTRLATGTEILNQAFRMGRNAYAFQFHPEMDMENLSDWFSNRPQLLQGHSARLSAIEPGYSSAMNNIFDNFFRYIH